MALFWIPNMPPFAASTAHAGVQATYYVSPTGSGSTCSSASPCSLTGAQSVVRTVNSNMTGDIIVYIMPGNYTVTSPITFDQSDSGTNGHTIRYENYGPVGSAVFLGGRAVTGWTQYSGNIYRANVGTGWAFNDLFENGRRAVKARTPNVSSSYGQTTTSQGPWLKNIAYSDTSNTTFKYNTGDLNPTGWNLATMQAMIFSGGYYNWDENLIPLAGVDSANHLITLEQNTPYGLTPGGRYFIQGDLSLLDAPGEYYLDQAGGYLYYYPRSTSIQDQTIIAPTVKDIFRFVGSSQTSLVHDVALRGLSLDYSDFVDQDPAPGTNLVRAPDAMIYLTNTQDITIEDCHLRNAGLTGIFMHRFNENNTIYGNWIEQSGVNGISMIGYDPSDPATADVNNSHVIENNKIEFVGVHGSYSAGIYMLFTGKNTVSHNQISHGARWLIGGGTVPDIPISQQYFANNYFGYNDLYGACEDTADCGAFYFFGSVYQAQANTIEQTRVDTARWNANAGLSETAPSGVQPNIGVWGIYFDNASNYWNARNISVKNVQTGAYLNNGNSNETLSNVSWGTGYNDSLVDHKNIGLLPDFPSAYGNGGYTWANDSDSQLTYTGSWAYNPGPVAGDMNGDETYTDTPGDSVQYTFNGTEVKWATSTSNNRGKADVYIDGVLDATVDAYTAGSVRQNVVYDKGGLSSGRHTIKIVVSSSKNPNSGGNYIVVDGIGATSNYVNDDLMTYSGGGWSVNTGLSGNYLGDEHYADTSGNSSQYSFNGTGVTWLASTSNNRGEADVYIDGVFDGTVDLYTATAVRQNAVYTMRGLIPGPHTIKIVVNGAHDSTSGGTYVTVDGLVVVPT
ncbi:hypothetical protein ACWEKM_13330 [Streptomyces sp. NPDC004752]